MSLRPSGVIWDLGNVLIDWQPHAAVAAGMGEEEATRFLGADDFDFGAFNHVLDGVQIGRASCRERV